MKNLKIILIDDGEGRNLTRQILVTGCPGIEIIDIVTPTQYLEVMDLAEFSLVITEYQLGWTDGFLVFADVHHRYPTIPVVMLSDYGDITIAVEAIKRGMVDYVQKKHRDSLPKKIAQILLDISERLPGNHEESSGAWSEKWDLALSKLTSDFAYSMRVSAEGEPSCEWVTEPFKRFIDQHCFSGYCPNALGWHFGFRIQPDDKAIVEEHYQSLLDGYEHTAEYRIISNRNEESCISDHALPIRDWHTGKVIRVYGAIQDITWRRHAENKLRLMQRAIDCSNNGIVITNLADTDYSIIHVNPAYLRLTGYTAEEMIGKNCRILQRDDHDQPDIENLRQALKQQCDGYAILRNYRKDGSQFWNEIYISPVLDSQQRVTHFIGVQNDVTPRIEMEISLQKSEAKLRAIFENVTEAILIFDAQLNIIRANPSAEKIFGYSNSEMQGLMLDRLLPELSQLPLDAFLSKQLPVNQHHPAEANREMNAQKKAGECFPVDVGISEITLEEQHHFIVTLHDLTKSKQAEAVLRISEERYRALFENSAEAIFINRNGNLVERVNKACIKLWLANKPEDLVGKNPFELFHTDYHPIIKKRIQQAMKNSDVQPMIEEKIVRLDGSLADVLVSAIPFIDDRGPLLFVILLDITSRKQAETALKESQSKHRELSNHLELIREEERARIARELHDELGSFLNMLKLDLSRLGKQLPAGLVECRNEAHAMEQQVNEGIQTVKKIITDLRPSILDHLGLFPAIEWQVESFRKRTGIHCLLTMPDIDLKLEQTRITAIFRIVQETLTNIIAHSKASEVVINIEISGNDLVLTINDNGVGMPPIQQGSPSGYGIQGMRERALYFGGEINFTSSPETGTTMLLQIPLKQTMT